MSEKRSPSIFLGKREATVLLSFKFLYNSCGFGNWGIALDNPQF